MIFLTVVLHFSATLAGNSCLWLFQNETYKTNSDITNIMKLLFYSKKGDIDKYSHIEYPNTPNSYFEKLWSHLQFRNYLSENKIHMRGNESQAEKYNLLALYVENFLTKYKNKFYLSSREEEAAKDRLIRHGWYFKENETALEGRQRLSANNLNRIMNEIPLHIADHVPEIEKAVEQLQLFMTHNSHIMTEAPTLPIIAPKEIDSMGLIEFGMSTWIFNRHIGSDNQVYFKALFKRTSSQENPVSEYGNHGVIMKRSYAKTHALISPFVMYPEQLLSSIENIAPKVAEEYSNYAHSIYGKVNGPEQTRTAQAHLHKLDFTPEDYEALTKFIIRNGLHYYHKNDFKRYKTSLQILEVGNIDEINSTINSFFNTFMNYKNAKGFEATVSIAVPETALEHF